MTNITSPGKKFRDALAAEKPLQIVGTVNAYCALMAERVGYKAIYLSGGACSAVSYGIPDLGITSLDNVLEDVWRITSACSLPLLVDIDTGWGNAFNIARTIQQMIKAGAAAVHIEDQVSAKRCGHRPGKKLVATQEMVDRIKAVVDAKTDSHFFIIARTDAVAIEGLSAAIERAHAYVEAGADAIFAEALGTAAQYREFCTKIAVPILANITEFGKTPLFTMSELRDLGVQIALFPWAPTRAMNAAAFKVLEQLRKTGTQTELIPMMQNRETLYDILNYHQYEAKLDELFHNHHHNHTHTQKKGE